MTQRTKTKCVNYIMLISLILVFVSGILLKPFPGMWMGITHMASAMLLVITVVLHCIQHGMFRKKMK